MRILWITTTANPYPRSGGGLRTLRLIQAVAGRWPVDVVNVGAGLDAEAFVAVSGARSARDQSPDVRSKPATVLLALRDRLPLPACRVHSAALRAEAAAAAEAGDLVVLDQGWLLGHLPGSGQVLVMLANVDSELVKAFPARGLRVLERAWNVWAYRRIERRLGHQPGCHVSVVSQRDADVLGYAASVVPNGADVPEQASPLPTAGPIVFVASMGYPPNVEAVEWWARRVWPASGLPPLTVIGQGGRAALSHLAGDSAVDVVGEVDDVAPWLERARIVAVPIISGSGTRLKVVEALAHARPVVSTTKGAEGTGAVHGQHLLLADSPSAFADAVRRLLDDAALAAMLSRSGRDLATSKRWPTIGESFAAVVSGIVAL